MGHRFEAPVGMLIHSALVLAGRHLGGTRVVEQQKGTQLLQPLVGQRTPDGEAVADLAGLTAVYLQR